MEDVAAVPEGRAGSADADDRSTARSSVAPATLIRSTPQARRGRQRLVPLLPPGPAISLSHLV